MNTENQFKFLDEPNDFGLYLGVEVNQKYTSDEFTSRYKSNDLGFKYLVHQTCGVACHQHYLFAKKLEPKPDILKLWIELDSSYYETNLGCFGNSLNELNEYRELLYAYELDCNVSYNDLEEAIYPIDIDCLKKVTDEVYPEELDDLLIFNEPFHRSLGCIGRWNLWILTQNSD